MQAASGFGRIRRIVHGPNDGDGRRTRVDHRGHIFEVDPTDRDEWPVDDSGDPGYERGTHGGAAFLGWGWVDGPGGGVNRALPGGGLRPGQGGGAGPGQPA